jgi:hypothetical protein
LWIELLEHLPESLLVQKIYAEQDSSTIAGDHARAVDRLYSGLEVFIGHVDMVTSRVKFLDPIVKEVLALDFRKIGIALNYHGVFGVVEKPVERLSLVLHSDVLIFISRSIVLITGVAYRCEMKGSVWKCTNKNNRCGQTR